MDFSFGSVVKNLPSNAGDTGSIPDRGRSLKKKKERKKERKLSTLATYIRLHINYFSIFKSTLLRQEKKIANETTFSTQL